MSVQKSDLTRKVFEALVSTHTDAICTIDGDGLIVVFNYVAEKLTGWSATQAIGKSFSDIVHFRTLSSDKILTAHEIIHKQYQRDFFHEMVLSSKNQTEYLVEVKAKSLFHLEHGQQYLMGTLFTFRDTTAQRRVDREKAEVLLALDLERTKLINLFEQTPIPLAMLEGDRHRFSFTNSAFAEMFLGGKQGVNRLFADALPELAQQGFDQFLDQVFSSGKTYHGKEITLSLNNYKEGEAKTLIVNFVLQPTQNLRQEVTGILMVATDVTELVKAREIVEVDNKNFIDRHQKLLSYFEKAPVGINVFKGPDHVFELVNERFKTFVGSRAFIGQRFVDAIPEVKSQGFIKILDQVLKTGVPYSLDGAPLTIEDNGISKTNYYDFLFQPLFDSTGIPTGVLQISMDVTASLAARQVIKNQQSWLESILNRMPTPLVLLDPQSNKITFSNDSTRNMMGFSLDGNAIFENGPENLIKAYDKAGRVLAKHEVPSARALRCEELKDYECTLVTTAGRFDILAASEVIPASHGHSKSILLLLQDISAVTAAEEQFRLLANTMPQIVWTATADGILNYCNQRWAEYSGSSYIGQWFEFIHPDDQLSAMWRWQESIRTEAAYEVEARLRRFSDGEYRWHLIRAVMVKDEMNVKSYWCGTCTDVTDQKKLQSDLQQAKNLAEIASEAKSAFLANMSHEIRTPLGAILGFTDLLQNLDLSAYDRQQYLAIISKSGKALTRVIDDILDLSKVEAGRLEFEMVVFSFNQLIEEVKDLFSESAKIKDINLQFCIDSSVPDLIKSDPVRLRQILLNIVGNAIKFTQSGEVTVKVRTEYNEDISKKIVVIYVKDSGPGLTQEQQQRLFYPFTQADISTTRNYGGTGLGLILSRRLAEALGGNVTITHSEPGVGSEFKISVTVEKIKMSAESQPMIVPVVSDDKPQLRGAKILLVEDSLDNQLLIQLYLDKNGANITIANNGYEGVQKALSEDFDVVLMDIQMPGMDGYSAICELKKKGYTKPIIALTAHAMDEERKRTKAAGFSGHLTKPLNTTELISTVAGFAFSEDRQLG